MSYLVLARKWRPKRFAELVGQEHVVRALSNALETGKVHHAFLFTGTRGVGKTTIARIFAKSLNCERGTGADPCGECSACVDIDAGRFVDLLEIDAASHTGVDNIRELIDNAQYMPSRGRIKVYLIDEVHMLSKPAFNALLKTLEEPPEHVKFLLATTDPDRLPVTVLSRCLQFNLKRLEEEQISGQMQRILEAEEIAVEPGALVQLAHAADGSLRDGLSLLDQAIAFTGGRLETALVADMLGTVDRGQVGELVAALAAADGPRLMAQVEVMAGFSPDFAAVLDALAAALHRIQLRQLVPGLADARLVGMADEGEATLATQVSAELVQLWYQMALNARRDLPVAPSARVGFEMALLRMLAFQPADAAAPPRATGGGRAMPAGPSHAAVAATVGGEGPPRSQAGQSHPARRGAAAAPVAAATPASAPAATAGPVPGEASRGNGPAMGQLPAPVASARCEPRPLGSSQEWIDLVAGLTLRGPVAMLAGHSGFVAYSGGQLTLSLPAQDEHLRSEKLVAQLAHALESPLGQRPVIRLETARAAGGATLHEHNQRAAQARQDDAEAGFLADPAVAQLIREHGARVVPDSIRPNED